MLHAALVARLALTGLLRGVGRSLRGHALARDYQATRCPDAAPEGTPRSNYTPADSARSHELASRLVTVVHTAWEALQERAASEEADG